jgi:hypothetical protein
METGELYDESGELPLLLAKPFATIVPLLCHIFPIRQFCTERPYLLLSILCMAAYCYIMYIRSTASDRRRSPRFFAHLTRCARSNTSQHRSLGCQDSEQSRVQGFPFPDPSRTASNKCIKVSSSPQVIFDLHIGSLDIVRTVWQLNACYGNMSEALYPGFRLH